MIGELTKSPPMSSNKALSGSAQRPAVFRPKIAGQNRPPADQEVHHGFDVTLHDMTPDEEVEFNCHLLNDIDPLTAWVALPDRTEEAADEAEAKPAALPRKWVAWVAVLLGLSLFYILFVRL